MRTKLTIPLTPKKKLILEFRLDKNLDIVDWVDMVGVIMNLRGRIYWI